MRIAFVTSEYVTENLFDGGLANYVHRTALALKERGHEPVVFVNSDRDETFFHRDIEIHRVDCRLPHELTKLPFKMLRRFYRFWCKCTYRSIYKNTQHVISEKLNNALLQAHEKNNINIIQYASFSSPALCRPKSIPAIVRASSYAPLWSSGYGTLHKALEEQNEIRAFSQADTVFSPSQLIANKLFFVLNQAVPVIESPFFIETCQSDETLLDKLALREKKYLLFFGTISLIKGCLTIAKILNPLFEKNSDLHFVFVGKTTSYQGKNFETLIRSEVDAIFQKRIIFVDKTPHAQLYPIICNAKGVILPSRVDNLPNTCLEAMGHGKIVVGTRGASFDQLITDGENGFLCEIDDTVTLFSAIEKLLSLTDNRKQQMSEAAVARIKQLHPDMIVPKLLDLYQSVIGGQLEHQAVKKTA